MKKYKNVVDKIWKWWHIRRVIKVVKKYNKSEQERVEKAFDSDWDKYSKEVIRPEIEELKKRT